MNLFRFSNFEVLVDYAHNPAGLKAIGEFLNSTHATRKVGIIAGVGDRRNEDTMELGRLAGELFDEIIIRQNKDLRDGDPEEIVRLLTQGINYAGEKEIKVIPEEMLAIAYALENATRDSFICIFSEQISEAIKTVENFRVIQDRRILVD